MTDESKLEMLRLMQGSSNEGDDILLAYLQIAGSKIVERAFPYGQYELGENGDEVQVFTVPDRYAILQVEIANYMLNKRGAEGQISHSESGVSRGYGSDDLPLNLISQVVPMCGGL